MKKLGFIGVGNMGGALLRGCSGKIPGSEIVIADASAEKTASFHREYGCEVLTAAGAAAAAEYLFIGVKPQMAADLFGELRDALAGREVPPVLVTMMAGRTMAQVRELAGFDCPIIRIMPNVAAAVGEAMILCDSRDVKDEQLSEFADFMSGCGKLDFLPEKLIDAGSSVSGCGPAYVCLFAEALADGAVKCGVPRKKALDYAVQTLLGTAKLLGETGKHPGVVKDEVTSPGGTTIEGIEALEENGFRYAVMQAVVRSFKKNRKL